MKYEDENFLKHYKWKWEKRNKNNFSDQYILYKWPFKELIWIFLYAHVFLFLMTK